MPPIGYAWRWRTLATHHDEQHGQAPQGRALKYGYARVSKDEQNPAMQLAALEAAGCSRTFTDEGVSGAVPAGHELGRLQRQARRR